MPKFVQFKDTIRDETGAIVPLAQIEVRTTAGALATIYSDEGVTPIVQPFDATADGVVEFYALAGEYELTATRGADVYTSAVYATDALHQGGRKNWDTRANLVTDWVDGLYPDGTVVTAGLLTLAEPQSYIASQGATGISDLPGLLPFNGIHADHWGCVTSQSLSGADTVADSAARVTEMLAYASDALYEGDVRFGSGYYRLTTPIDVPERVRIVGEGPNETFLHGDHRDGEVVRFRDIWSGLDNIGVTASAFRKAGRKTFDPVGTVDTTLELFSIAGHGWVNGDLLLYSHGAGGTAIGGLTQRTRYYVVNATTDTFQLSATEGGAAIALAPTWAGTAHSLRQVNQFGVLFETDDLPENDTGRLFYSEMTRFYIAGQPDDGLHVIGAAFTGLISDFNIVDCGGHGIYFDRGEKKGRTNLITSLIGGVCDIKRGRFGTISGHLICAGSPNGTYTGSDFSTPALRINIANCEGGGASVNDPGVYYEDATLFLRGANHHVLDCGFSGSVNAIAYVAGRSIHLRNNRYLSSDGVNFYRIGTYDELPTEGVYIDGMLGISPTVSYDPLVSIEMPAGETTEPSGIWVNQLGGSNIARIVDVGTGLTTLNDVHDLYINGQLRPKILEADQTVNNTTTPANINGLLYPMRANELLYFDLVAEFTGAAVADIRFDIVAPVGGACRYGWKDSITVTVEGSVAAAADLNVAADPAERIVTITGYCQAGSAGGNLVPRFAQLVADASDTTLKAGITRLSITKAS